MKYISLFIGVLIFLNLCNSGTAKKSNIQTDDPVDEDDGNEDGNNNQEN